MSHTRKFRRRHAAPTLRRRADTADTVNDAAERLERAGFSQSEIADVVARCERGELDFWGVTEIIMRRLRQRAKKELGIR